MTLGMLNSLKKGIHSDKQCSSGGFCYYSNADYHENSNKDIFTCFGCNDKRARNSFIYVSKNVLEASRNKQTNSK